MQASTGEQERERYRELLEELRTILPGVQVLFAFLLTAPFSQRFTQVDEYGRDLYGIALVGTAVATVLFLTPAAYHRIAPRDERGKRLTIAVRLMVLGMAVLAISVLTAVVAVVRFIFGTEVATAVGVPLGALMVLMWYLLPWRRRSAFGRGSG